MNFKLTKWNFIEEKAIKQDWVQNKNWFIDCIDVRTKFLVSAEYFKTREQKQLIKVLRLAKSKNKKSSRSYYK